MALKIPAKEVWSVLERYYRIIPETFASLGSYQHANFKVTARPRDKIGGVVRGDEASYVLKFADKSHFSYCGNTDLQHAMQQHLNACGIKSSSPIATQYGKTIVDHAYAGKMYTVQLLTFVEGVCLNDTDLGPSAGEVFSRVGKLCARVHRSLETLDFDIDQATAVNSPYHAQNALDFESKLEYVKEIELRKLLRKYLDLFRINFLPRLNELRRGFVHGDFSTTNIILQYSGENDKLLQQELYGIIDFEECCYGYLVGELGIAVAYVMLKATDNPIEISRRMIDGYQRILPLTEPEKEVLFEVVTARMVVSYASACYEKFVQPENVEFLFSQPKSVPATLKLIEEVGKEGVVNAWFGDR